jgi:hypothetical protein
MKIAIIGNTNWQNKRKVKDILYSIKQKYPEATVVGGGGKEGANHMVKKYALEFGMEYAEYNPSFSGFNMYSAMPKSYYGKQYHFSQLHHRMKLLALSCDYIMILTNDPELDPVLKTAYNQAKKSNKSVVILN